MSVVTRQIAAVEFQANSKQANEAIESMRQEAKKCNDEVAKLQELLDKDIKTINMDGKNVNVEKRLNEQKTLARTYNDAANAMVKGVKAWDELWKHAKIGDLEKLSGQQLKAGMNGGKRQYERLILGDEEDRRKAAAIKDILDQSQIVLDKLQARTQEVINTIGDGGHVADEVLQREKKYLQDMMDLSEKFGPEWQEYNVQLQTINNAIKAQTADEKRLRGEIVDVNDAKAEAAKLDKDAAEKAKQNYDAQQKIIDAAKEQTNVLNEQRRMHQANADKLEESIKEQDLQIRKQQQVVDGIKAEYNARTKALNKVDKEADNLEKDANRQKKAYDKEITKIENYETKIESLSQTIKSLQEQLAKLGSASGTQDHTILDKLNQDFEEATAKVTEAQKKFDEINNKSLAEYEKDNPRAKQLKDEIAQINELIAVSEKYRKQFAKMSDASFEKSFFGNKEEKSSSYKAEDYLKRAYQDKLSASVADMNPDVPEIQESAKRVAAGVVKNAQENFRRALYNEIKNGQLTSQQLQERIANYRESLPSVAREAGGNISTDPEYNAYKYVITQMEKYLEVAKQVEAERAKMKGGESFLKEAQDSYKGLTDQITDRQYSMAVDVDKKAMEQQGADILKARQELTDATNLQKDALEKLRAEQKKYDEASTSSADTEKQRTKLTKQLTDAQTRLATAQSNLAQSETDRDNYLKSYQDLTAKADKKREEVVNADNKGKKEIEDATFALGDLNSKREESVALYNKEKAAINETTKATNEQATIIHNAQVEQSKNRQLSIDSIEKSIDLLRQQNRVLGDETNPEWVENEKLIGRLNERLEEMKQKAAELRGEALSTADALKTADIASGKRVSSVEPVESRVERETAGTRSNIAVVDRQRTGVLMHMQGLQGRMDELKVQTSDLKPYVDGLKESTKALSDQNKERQSYIDTFKEEANGRKQAIDEQKAQIALIEKERNDAIGLKNARIEAAQNLLSTLKALPDDAKNTGAISDMIQVQVKSIQQLQKERFDIASQTEERLKKMNEQLAESVKADEEATVSAETVIDGFNQKIAATEAKMKEFASSAPTGFDSEDVKRYAIELSNLNIQLEEQRKKRTELTSTYETEQIERKKGIEAQKEQIALIQKESAEAITKIDQRIKAQQESLEALKSLNPQTDTFKQMSANIEQEIKRLQEEKTALESSAEAKQKLADANQKLEDLIKADADATAKEKATLQQYDEQIKKLEQDIADYTQKISNAKNPRDEQEYEEDAKQMESLKNKLAELNEEKEKYIEQLQRETEEATRAAEAEKAAAEAEQGGVSINDMQQAIATLQEARKSATSQDDVQRYGDAIDTLTQKIKEATGEAMSLQDALKMGNDAMANSFKGTNDQLKLAKKTLEDALATTEKGSDRYNQIRDALQGIALEEQRVGERSAKVNEILDHPKGKSFIELKLAVEEGRKALNGMDRSTKENQQAFDDLAKKVKECDLEMKNLAGESKGTANAFEKAWTRLKTYVTFYVGAAAALQKIGSTVDDLMELSDKMGEVRKTTGFTADQVGRLSDNLAKLDTRTSLTSLLDLSAAAGQLGLTTQEDIQGFTEAANEMLVALPELGQDGATEMMKVALATGEVNKIQQQMQDGSIQGSSATAVAMEKVGSVIDRLRASTAAAAGPITDFVKRVGAVGAQSGISMDQVAALGATVDSLGMGTEMAATAISRMIPAIKNNAFSIAQAIGVKPNTLRDLFAAGKGMEAVLLVLQKMHDEDMGPDTIEKMLGENGMSGLMKELDQQGARAGIVFAGLSQNVDVLRDNLKTANQAYKDGTAITNEYNKMNETTAAKWERLKNQVEELFVTAANSERMGVILDFLRGVANFLTDDGPIGSFLRYGLVYLALWKAKWAETIGSVLMSLGSFVLSLRKSTAATTADAAAKEANATATTSLGNAEVETAVKTNVFSKAWGNMSKAMKANIITAVATAVVWLGMTIWDTARKSKEAAEQQKKDLDEVGEAAEKETAKERVALRRLYEATQDQTKSMAERKQALHDMVGDAKYNQYYKNLNNESELAKAASKAYQELAEKIIQTARARALDAKAEKLEEQRIELEDKLEQNRQWRSQHSAEYQRASKAYKAQQNYVGGVVGGATAGFTESSVAMRGQGANKPKIIDQMAANTSQEADIRSQMKQNDADMQRLEGMVKKNAKSGGTGVSSISGGNGGGGGTGGNGGGGTGGFGSDENNPWGKNNPAASTDWSKMTAKTLVDRRKQMNDFVKALQEDTDVDSVLEEDPALQNAIKKGLSKDMTSVIGWYNTQRLKIQDELHKRFLTNTGNWQDPKTAKQSRRKASKMIKDEMSYYLDSVDAYYTAEKSKIEEAQNDGQITEAEGWRRTLQNEQEWRTKRAQLQQLYTKQSEKVTKADQERIFDIISDRTGESADVIKSNIQSTINFIKEIAKKSPALARAIEGNLDKGIEQDFFKVQKAVSTQMAAITDIVNKERPFNGIVDNLQTNLQKMGLLQADLEKRRQELLQKGYKNSDNVVLKLNDEYQKEVPQRLTFLLEESEKAYELTWDQLASDMRKKGFGDWADAISFGDNADESKRAILAQLHSVYDDVQEAIKKEASLVKKEVENIWNDTMKLPNGMSMKQTYENAIDALGIENDRTSRANSLINAGPQSERVADKLAIKQMQIQLDMQQHYYNLMQKIGLQRVQNLRLQAQEAKEAGDLNKAKQLELDADHAQLSVDLSRKEETKDIMKLQSELDAKVEESENRLYTHLKEWGSLLSSSVQSMFEASNSGLADYYDNLAKMRLTGEGAGGGTYVVIDNSGTKDASAHYETLDGEQALQRQLQIQQQNATAEAWRKVMDDINKKINDEITDWMNSQLQDQAINANTDALVANTAALNRLLDAQAPATDSADDWGAWKMKTDENGNTEYPNQPTETNGDNFWQNASMLPGDGTIPWQTGNGSVESILNGTFGMPTDDSGNVQFPFQPTDTPSSVTSQPDAESGLGFEVVVTAAQAAAEGVKAASDDATQTVMSNQSKMASGAKSSDKKMESSSQSAFAKMAQAANMYGVTYQAMTNDNLSASQKFHMIALQAVGQTAMAALTSNLSEQEGQTQVQLPGILGKLLGEMNPWAAFAIYATITAMMGALMALATSKVSKSKSQISQVTGAGASAGRLTTGMLTYAEGNVNEFTDPDTLTPGKSYNVDAADGRTYRAKYTGKNPTTHITNGPEFHLAGERGKEAIIDAHTTRLLQMDDTGIWKSIQTLYNGGSLQSVRRSTKGMRAFATGNLDDFDDALADSGVGEDATSGTTLTPDAAAAMQQSLDRNNELLQRALDEGIHAKFDVYGKGGLIDSYDTGKKTVNRHGERY